MTPTRLALAVIGGAFACSTALAQGGATVLVIDASNSMWGRVDGRPKIEIAREAVGAFAGALPKGSRLGLVAYGHRRATDCADIETLRAPAPVDPADLAGVVNRLTPRGKTPITAALRQAAGALGGGGSIVIVTDGVETCGGDPCALAEELKRANAGLVAHVVGFDLRTARERASVACIAERTGGTFVSALGAGDLARAMRASATARPRPVAPIRSLALAATDGPGGRAVPDALFTLARRGEEGVVASGVSGAIRVAPGTYRIAAAAPGRTGSLEVEIRAGGPDRVVVPLTGALPGAEIAPEAPSAPAAGRIGVRWSGPDAAGDYLAVARADGGTLETGFYAFARDGNPATLRVPGEPGAYELRYVHGATEAVLARAPLAVTPVSASVKAPAGGMAGREIAVSFTGPRAPEDWIGIVPVGAAPESYESGLWESVTDQSEVRLRLPGAAGAYEVRYVAGLAGKVLAMQPIAVTAASAAVSAPGRAGAGSTIEVEAKGPPGGPNTFVGIVKRGAPPSDYIGGSYEAPSETGRVALRVPGDPGAYEIRYVLDAPDGYRVLATAALTVEAAVARVAAPDRARRGGRVPVTFDGPKGQGDFVTIVRAGADPSDYLDYRDAHAGPAIALEAPSEPGAYEVRYVMAAPGDTGHVVLARRPLRVG
ncbi:MAG TPA: VWA domain-containing protein [Salinarimonas sp.]|nr:VWA domain-containing protein [Salinarimonas sp.]